MLIPLSLHTIIFQTSPFWTSILGFLYNKERIYRFEYGAMTLCFVGVVLLALNRPTQQTLTSASLSTVGIVITFVMSWNQALINVVNRKLRDVHFAIIGFYHPILGLTVVSAYMGVKTIVTGEGMGSHSAGIYFTVFVACCFDFLQLCSQNIAFQNDSSGFVSILGYVSVAYGFLADEIIFQYSITGVELLGASLIFIVCLATAVAKLRLKSKATPKS